jgi:hypothetical protein
VLHQLACRCRERAKTVLLRDEGRCPLHLVASIACPRSNSLRQLFLLSGVRLSCSRSVELAQTPAVLLLKQVFTFGQMTELGHCIAMERDQNPANPSGLLYGMATLVTSSSEPSGLVAYPTSFEAFP